MDRVLIHLVDGAGTELDVGIVRAFVRMMQQWGDRNGEVSDLGQAIPRVGS